MARYGKLLFHSRRNAPFGAVLENRTRRRSGAGTEKSFGRPLSPHRACILRRAYGKPRFDLSGTLRNGKRGRENSHLIRLPFMDPSDDVFSNRTQRPPLVHSVRHDRRTARHRGNVTDREVAEKIFDSLTRYGGGRSRCGAFRFQEHSVPNRRMTGRGMVSNVQSVPVLIAFPSLNGGLRRGHLGGNEKGSALVLVRRAVPRKLSLNVLLSLGNPRIRRFRLFLAGVTVPVSARSDIARHIARKRGVYEKNLNLARQRPV